MARGFPTFESHSVARCHACGGLLSGPPKPSGMPPRQGEHQARCFRCGKSTWYDLAVGDTARPGEQSVSRRRAE